MKKSNSIKRKLIIVVITLLIIVATPLYIFFGMGKELPNIDQVNGVSVRIYGHEEDLTFHLQEEANIQKVLEVQEELNAYEDPEVCTWFLNVELTYQLVTGKSKVYTYKDIRPAHDYFEDIYASMEYKVNTNPFDSLQAEEIDQVVISECPFDREWRYIISDREVIEELLRAGSIYWLNMESDKEYLSRGRLEFKKEGETLQSAIILRENDPFYQVLSDMVPESLALYDVQSEIDHMIISKDDDQELTVTDPLVYTVVLEHYYDFWSRDCSEYSVEIVLKDEEERHIYGSFLKADVPLEIPELFN